MVFGIADDCSGMASCFGAHIKKPVPENESIGSASPLLSFYVNGEEVCINSDSGFDPETTILEYVRKRGLTGTKLVCGEGGCGACTVVVSRKDPQSHIYHRPINACLATLADVHGAHVTTIEGLAKNFGKNKGKEESIKYTSPYVENSDECLHPVQKAIVDSHGSQCGYCTPGFVMSVYAKYVSKIPSGPADSVKCNAKHKKKCMQPQDIEDCLDGNLCRCTGYRPIYQGFMEGLCEKHNDEEVDFEANLVPHLDVMMAHLLPEVQIPSLRLAGKHLGEDCVFHRPKTVKEVLHILDASTNYRLQVGSTERRIEMVRVGNHKYPMDIISLAAVQGMATDMHFLGDTVSKGVFRIGAAVPVADMEHLFKGKVETLKKTTSNQNLDPNAFYLSQLLDSYVDMLRWFAGQQIRNAASLGGNIVTASPIADLNPLHVAACGSVQTAKLVALEKSAQNQTRSLSDCSTFWTAYRKTALEPKEIIENVEIPTTVNGIGFFRSYKQARRKEDDISIVNAAFRVVFEEQPQSIPTGEKKLSFPPVLEATFVFGGMAPTIMRCTKLENFWKEQASTILNSGALNETEVVLIEKVTEIVEEAMKLPLNVPGGMAEFRLTLCKSFVVKFVRHCVRGMTLWTTARLQQQENEIPKKAAEILPISLLLDPTIDGVVSEEHALKSTQVWKGKPEKNSMSISSTKDVDASSTGKDAHVSRNALGKANPHLAAQLHVTGRAQYATDKPESVSSALDGGFHGGRNLSKKTKPADDGVNSSAEMHLDFLLSEKPHAVIEHIDYSACEKIPGYIGKIDYADVKSEGHMKVGPIIADDCIFPIDGLVTHLGQVVCCILATDRMLARDCARAVKVVYKEELPFVMSLEEAIAKQSFHPVLFKKPGDMDAQIYTRREEVNGVNLDAFFEEDMNQLNLLKESDAALNILHDVDADYQISETQEVLIQGQEHFYFETHSSAVEFRDNDIILTTSNQGLAETQHFIHEVTGYPMHKIHCKTVRCGGGFGGKETRAALFALYPVIAGLKYRRDCRFSMERDTDFKCSGMRHSFVSRYKVIVNKTTKKILAVNLILYANAGCSYDLSMPVLNRAMLHSENCMFLPNIKVRGMLCKTNLPSNTAFRGFGGPQGLFVAEKIAETAANMVSCTREDILEANFYPDDLSEAKNQVLTFYNHPLGGCPITRMWAEIKQKCDYEQRREAVLDFNRQQSQSNGHRRRGISLLPTKYGISFTAKHLNQSAAQVNIYKDGTILINHGGVEIGQGLHTKVAAVAASIFDLPISAIHIAETNTSSVPNASPTAASTGSDLNGFAVQKACLKLLARLENTIITSGKGEILGMKEVSEDRMKKIERHDYDPSSVRFVRWNTTDSKDDHVSDTQRIAYFADIVNQAWFNRINLSSYGYYKTPISGVDWNNTEVNSFAGEPFYYYAWGVACAEVEVDCLTGDHLVLRSDIIHDVGKSLNPVIDIGQIEGAFTQGLGLFTTEEVVYLQTSLPVKGSDDTRESAKPRQAKFFSVGPGNYKIPSLRSIPRDFRVHLLEDCPGNSSVMGSKAVGEPPLFLGCSAYFAICEAIREYNKSFGSYNSSRTGRLPRLDAPLTSEKIRMACTDSAVNKGGMLRQPTVASSKQEVQHWHARV